MEVSITCEVCKSTFKMKKSLYRHQRDVHGMEISAQCCTYRCSLCDWKFTNICQYGQHLTQTHSQDITIQHLTLDSETDFQNWKADLEKETIAEYVQRRGPATCKKGGKQTTYYYCHRSGHFNSRVERKRQLKLMGTNKIDGICPAFIKKVVTRADDSVTSVSVTYCDKHLGHQMEPGRLHLPQQSKKAIAAKLAVGVPLDRVLMEENQNFSSNRRATTRKDLHNIIASFNIDKNILNMDGDSLDPCELQVEGMPEEQTLIVITNEIENEQRDSPLEAERHLLLMELQEMMIKVTNMNSIENIRMISENIKQISAELQANQMMEDQPIVI